MSDNPEIFVPGGTVTDEEIEKMSEKIMQEAQKQGLPWWSGIFNPEIVKAAFKDKPEQDEKAKRRETQFEQDMNDLRAIQKERDRLMLEADKTVLDAIQCAADDEEPAGRGRRKRRCRDGRGGPWPGNRSDAGEHEPEALSDQLLRSSVRRRNAMKPINPRPGVSVAITDRRGELACYDPNAYRRKECYRNEKIRRENGICRESDRSRRARRSPLDGRNRTENSTSSLSASESFPA